MVRFEYFLACSCVLIKRTKSYFNFYKIYENVSAIQVSALWAIAFKVSEISAFIRMDRQTDSRTDGQRSIDSDSDLDLNWV